MSQRMNQYKQGSYGSGSKSKSVITKNYIKRSAANQAAIGYKRDLAPLARRGFNPMAVANNRERKYFDTPGNSYRVNTDGTFLLAHIPVKGSDYNNRIGRKNLIRSLYIRGAIELVPANSVEDAGPIQRIAKAQVARMIVFIDSQPNGSAPTRADLLQEAEPRSHLNPNNRDRFRILKDKLYTFDPYVYKPIEIGVAPNIQGAVAAFNRTSYTIKMYKKLNVETIFNDSNDATIAAINTNALYVFWIGNHAPDVNLEVAAKVSLRVRFDDT